MTCTIYILAPYALIGSQEKYEKVFLDSLQRGIYELQLANVIRVLQDLSTKTSNEYLLDFSNLYLDTEKEQFVTIFSEEIYKILACEEVMKKKISMLKYFIAIVSTFNWSKSMRKLQGKIGTMSMEYIALPGQQHLLFRREQNFYKQLWFKGSFKHQSFFADTPILRL